MKFGVLLTACALAAADAVACNGFVVGKKASATGYVIVSHNEDNLLKHRVRHAMLPAGAPLFDEPGCVKIPQAERTYACFWSEVKSDDGDPRPGDLFYNENGVMVYSNNGGVYDEWDGQTWRLPDEGRWSQCVDGGLGINLRFAVAQRARTAAEGVSIMTNLVMTYGYAPLSRVFTIADKDEAWLVQVVHGRRYVARRCPDDEVTAYPNALTIDRIRPGDLCSPNIEAKRDTFDFMATYQGPRTWKSPFNLHRWMDMYRIVAGLDVPLGERYPFSLKPTHKVSVDDVKRGLSSHYEGQPHEVRPKHPEKGPKVLEPICRRTTLESMVCAFGAKPSEDVIHLAVGRPCEVPYETSRPFGGAIPKDAATGAEAVRWIRRHYQKERIESGREDLVLSPQMAPKAVARAIQARIDAVSDAGGGVVSIPKGEWVSGTIWLRSGVELHLERDATLKASSDLDDYNAEDAYPENFGGLSESWSGRHLVIAHRVNDVAITGPGALDGNGDAFYVTPTPQDVQDKFWPWFRFGMYNRSEGHPERLRPGPLVAFVESKGIEIEGLRIRNSACWSLLAHGCEDVVVHDYDVRNRLCWANSDGIDIDCCRRVRITDAFIESGDDAIAIRANGRRLRRPGMEGKCVCEDVVVANCVLASGCWGVRIGVGDGVIRNVDIGNCVVRHAGGGVSVVAAWNPKQMKAVEIGDVKVHGCLFRDCPRAVEIVSALAKGSVGGVKGLTFSDCSFDCMINSCFRGSDENPPTDIRFLDCDFRVLSELRYPGKNRMNLGKMSKAKTRPVVFENDRAKDVVFRNCRLSWPNGPTHLERVFSSEKGITVDGGDLRNRLATALGL